jgi:hypothetical protein
MVMVRVMVRVRVSYRSTSNVHKSVEPDTTVSVPASIATAVTGCSCPTSTAAGAVHTSSPPRGLTVYLRVREGLGLGCVCGKGACAGRVRVREGRVKQRLHSVSKQTAAHSLASGGGG